MGSFIIPTHILIALLIGLVPSIIWLLFWLQTDRDRPEPFGLLFLSFLLGAAAVFFATTLQQATKHILLDNNVRIAVWAGIEEVLKFIVFYIFAYKNPHNDEAIDSAVYLIAIALGFAALENIFYVLEPAQSFNITASMLTGTLRFFGSTLLHTIASCFVGICIGLSTKRTSPIAICMGLLGATFLHATFNFFILKNDTASFLQIYGYLWVAAIISHLILEKLRRLPRPQAIPLV